MTELPKAGELSLSARMPVARTRLGDGRAQQDSSWTLKPGEKRVAKPSEEEVLPQVAESEKKVAETIAELDVNWKPPRLFPTLKHSNYTA